MRSSEPVGILAITPTPGLPPTGTPDHSDLLRIQNRAKRALPSLALRYGLVLAINLAGTVVLSRLLGPSLWGVFAIAQVVYMSSQEVLGRGVATYLIKKRGAPSPAELRTTFAVQHLLGLSFLILVIAITRPAARWYGRQELIPLLLAAALASYGYAWRSIPLALLERGFEYVKVAGIEVLEAAIFSGVAIVLAGFGHAIAGLTAAIALRSLLPTGLAYLLRPARPALLFCRHTVGTVADFGLSVAAGSLVNIAILSVPALFVGKLAGMEALGVVQLAFSLYGSLLFATAAILRLSFSTYSRLVEFPGELQKQVNQYLEGLSAILLPAIVLFAGLSPAWVPLIFGVRWHLLPALLLTLAPGYFFVSVFWGILSPALLVSGKHRQMLLWLAGFLAAYGLLSWRLTRRWGALGVPAAFSAIEVLFHPLLFWMYTRVHGRLRYNRISAEMAAGAISLALLWTATHYNSLAAVMVVTSYLTVWYLRNGQDLRSIGAVVNDPA
jgi:O-antigen/teichoic acid export membrane protein